MKYEDLMNNQQATMTEAFEFVLEQESLEATYIQSRINKFTTSSESGVLYKPRKAEINSNTKHFTEKQIQTIKDVCRNEILYFGYAKTEQNPNGHI